MGQGASGWAQHGIDGGSQDCKSHAFQDPFPGVDFAKQRRNASNSKVIDRLLALPQGKFSPSHTYIFVNRVRAGPLVQALKGLGAYPDS